MSPRHTKIAVINTGGTISCVSQPLGPMTAPQFAAAAQACLGPILAQRFPHIQLSYLSDVRFPGAQSETLDSTNIQPRDWCIVAQAILQHYPDYDGFVVLHGTDSMSYTGAALPFLLNGFDAQGQGTALLSKPVILTGSQRPLFLCADGDPTLLPESDALDNFCGAIACAAAGLAEVGVFFHHQLYRSSHVVKTHTSADAAFSSPNYPALAAYGPTLTLHHAHILPPPQADVSLDQAALRQHRQHALAYIHAHIDQYPVAQLNAFPCAYRTGPTPSSFMATLIDALVAAGSKGLILESYGTGNFPSGNPDHPEQGAIYQALKRAHQAGVHLINCTQVLAGPINTDTYAAGAWLPQIGVLTPPHLTPMTALTKLTLLLTTAPHQQWSREQVRRLMVGNLWGECGTPS